MRTVIITSLVFAFSAPAIADQYVRGHVRSDGTYVAPHYRSSPDGRQWNNYSTQGNMNPYTGQQGSQRDTTYDPPKLYNPYERRSR